MSSRARPFIEDRRLTFFTDLDSFQRDSLDWLDISDLSGGEMQEIRVEQLTGKLRRLQQVTPITQSLIEGKKVLEEDLEMIKSVSDSLLKELASLQAEAYQLEGIHKEKEELCRKLQFQYDESEQDSARHLENNMKSDELLEQFRCGIQELKLKHRKQRMKFENQLQLLIEQHKNLHSVFTLERLPGEIESAEKTKSQLLSAEQMKLDQLHNLEEQLEEAKTLKQPGSPAAEA